MAYKNKLIGLFVCQSDNLILSKWMVRKSCNVVQTLCCYSKVWLSETTTHMIYLYFLYSDIWGKIYLQPCFE